MVRDVQAELPAKESQYVSINIRKKETKKGEKGRKKMPLGDKRADLQAMNLHALEKHRNHSGVMGCLVWTW